MDRNTTIGIYYTPSPDYSALLAAGKLDCTATATAKYGLACDARLKEWEAARAAYKGEKIKVLFLDFDGVIVTFDSLHECQTRKRRKGAERHVWDRMDRNAIDLIQKLLDRNPELRIVVSSSWRGNGHHQYALYPIDLSRVIGTTGRHRGCRGVEIQEWLFQHPEVEEFVIVDDETDMAFLLPHLVVTSFLPDKEYLQGFQDKHIDQCEQVLAGNYVSWEFWRKWGLNRDARLKAQDERRDIWRAERDAGVFKRILRLFLKFTRIGTYC